MANNIIKGRKGGGSKQRTPTEQPDDLQSVAKAKILLALGEGEFAGGLTGKDIYLDGTPLENADGSQNFSGRVLGISTRHAGSDLYSGYSRH